VASFAYGRADPAGPVEATVPVVVVAAICEEHVGAVSGSADDAGHRRDPVEQGQQLGDVVAIAAGQRHRERDALAVDEDVVLAARPCPVDRAGSAFGPLLAARTWEKSISARDRSGFFAPAASSAARDVAGPPRRPRSTRPGAAGASCPSRSPGSGAGVAAGCRCAARTGSRTGPVGPASPWSALAPLQPRLGQ